MDHQTFINLFCYDFIGSIVKMNNEWSHAHSPNGPPRNIAVAEPPLLLGDILLSHGGILNSLPCNWHQLHGHHDYHHPINSLQSVVKFG